MARVYLSCHHPDSANELAFLLTGPHEVVSTWHVGSSPRPNHDDAEGWAASAAKNMKQIDSCEVFVVIASPEHLAGTGRVSGGKFVEAGYALNHALASGGPRVFTVGGVENEMLYHPTVEHVETYVELMEAIR